MRPQRRGRAIAMNADEVDAYLTTARTCRVGTVGAGGAPHVSALWFVWDGSAVWLNSIVKSQRWVNVTRSPRVSVLVDGGDEFMELHGVEVIGEAEVVGDVPRTDAPDPALAEPERLFGDKYAGGRFVADGRHAWLRVVPDKVVSWDFRKIGASTPRRGTP
jgi:Pyridoxamine 5'-phosphate oxidase